MIQKYQGKNWFIGRIKRISTIDSKADKKKEGENKQPMSGIKGEKSVQIL